MEYAATFENADHTLLSFHMLIPLGGVCCCLGDACAAGMKWRDLRVEMIKRNLNHKTGGGKIAFVEKIIQYDLKYGAPRTPPKYVGTCVSIGAVVVSVGVCVAIVVSQIILCQALSILPWLQIHKVEIETDVTHLRTFF